MPRLLRFRAARGGAEPPPRPAPAGDGPIEVHPTDDQDEVPDLDLDRYARLVADVLDAEGVTGPGEVSLLFVDRASIEALNRHHLGGDGPTDVLSFPLDGAEPLTDLGAHRVVGDLVVCPGVARDQAADHAGDLDAELALLAVHGTLHLCGYDHAEPAERDAMWARERALLDRCWGPLPADPWSVTPTPGPA